MSGTGIVLLAIAIVSVSGIPGFLLTSRSNAGQRLTALLMAAGSAGGLFGTAVSAADARAVAIDCAWGLPWGRFVVAVDPISIVFLALIFVVPALGSMYGLEYWKTSEQPLSGPRLGLSFGLLAGSMAMVVIARDAVLFLIAWEVMALAAFFAATAEEDNAAVRRAGWVYLIATHTGTLCLIAMFALWRHAVGSFALDPVASFPVELAAPTLVLAMIGFGAKAGLMPLHVWLPGAHAGAPSHVSAVMSGVMLNMGIYGIVRMTMLLPVVSPWWGGYIVMLGAVAGIGGIAFAIGQHDVKRLLAYSSIENIGIITMGLGLALLGRSTGRTDWVVLGLGGALLHVWNHGLYKALLFLGAGAILHATHTREIDQLGGLAQRMPKITALFALGAVAICGLPPLNGFASEWMLYVGLLRMLVGDGVSQYAPLAATAVVLAMIGALTVACFVKLFGAVFLGSPRTDRSASAVDPSARMLAPMAVLAGGCVCLGLLPALAAPVLESATRTWAGLSSTTVVSVSALAPLARIGEVGLALLVSTSLITLAAGRSWRLARSRASVTWDCGYARPTTRMQYTSSSLARALVIQFRFILLPRSHRGASGGLFPTTSSFKSVVPDAVLDRALVPLFRTAGRWLSRARVLQQGQTQTYVLYIVLVLVVLLLLGPIGARP